MDDGGVCTVIYLCYVYYDIGLFSFSSSNVPVEAGVLDTDALRTYDHCLKIITAPRTEYNFTFKIFALNVLYNILSIHPGRAEFFNTRHILSEGEGRQDAIERHQLFMLKKLTKFIERVPTEIQVYDTVMYM